MRLEEKKKLWEAKRAQITASRLAKAEAWRTELAAKRIEKKSVPKTKTPEEVKSIEKIAVEENLETKPVYRKRVSRNRKKLEIARKRTRKKLRLEKIAVIREKRPSRLEKEIIEKILKEPTAETTKETARETMVPEIEEKTKEESAPVNIKTKVLSGSFTDISIPQKSGKKDLGLGAGRFKELEEKLKKMRRF